MHSLAPARTVPIRLTGNTGHDSETIYPCLQLAADVSASGGSEGQAAERFYLCLDAAKGKNADPPVLEADLVGTTEGGPDEGPPDA